MDNSRKESLLYLFRNTGETLLCAIPASKNKTKYISSAVLNKWHVLCITKKRHQLRLHKTKWKKGRYHSTKSWRLEDLKSIESGSAQSSHSAMELDFSLRFENSEAYTAATPRERNALLWFIVQISERNMPQIIRFDVMELGLLAVAEKFHELYEQAGRDMLESIAESADASGGPRRGTQQALISPPEEEALESLLQASGLDITDVEAFCDNLENESSALEAANIHSILESESRVSSLVEEIDVVVENLSALGGWIGVHNERMTTMRSAIKLIEKQNNRMEVMTRNNIKLLEELDALLNKLGLDEDLQKILKKPEFGTLSGLDKAIRAAHSLELVFDDPSIQGLRQMKAVKERIKLLNEIRDGFALEAHDYLCAAIGNIGNNLLQDSVRYSRKGKLVSCNHRVVHDYLIPYAPLVRWLKSSSNEMYDKLRTYYVSVLSKVYKKEFKLVVNELKKMLSKKKKECRILHMSVPSHKPPLRGKGMEPSSSGSTLSINVQDVSGMSRSATGMSGLSVNTHSEDARSREGSVISSTYSMENQDTSVQFEIGAAHGNIEEINPLLFTAVDASHRLREGLENVITGGVTDYIDTDTTINHYELVQVPSIKLQLKTAPKLNVEIASVFLITRLAGLLFSEERFLSSFFAFGGDEYGSVSDDDEQGGIDELNPEEADYKAIVAAKSLSVGMQWELAQIMTGLMESVLPGEFEMMLNLCVKYDPYVHRLTQEQNLTEGSSVYLSNLLEPICSSAEDQFKKFMLEQCHLISEFKTIARRAGIIIPVSRLPVFLDGLLAHLSVWNYGVFEDEITCVVERVFSAVSRVAVSDAKYSSIVRLENYHSLWVNLTNLGNTMGSLGMKPITHTEVNEEEKKGKEEEKEGEKFEEGEEKQNEEEKGEEKEKGKEGVGEEIDKTGNTLQKFAKKAEALYIRNLNRYGCWIIDCQFGSFESFFRDIQGFLDAATPVEEVKYRFSHSVQKYIKLLKSHQPKDLEKGVISMQKRVEKHLCEEEGLLTLVWGVITEQFVQRYAEFGRLARRCYPDSPPLHEFNADTRLLLRISRR